MTHSDILTQRLSPLIAAIRHHSLYDSMHSLDHLRIFMEHHVFAVWDFMCLLKELHRRIVSTQAPWFPPRDAYCAQLINRIMVEEEGDVAEDGIHYLSHFEIYQAAMQKIGANTQPIQAFLRLLAEGHAVDKAAITIQLPSSVQRFVQTTFSFFQEETPALAAAFVYGREAITPSLFIPLVHRLEGALPSHEKSLVSTLLYYLKRHIDLDDADHFPHALKILKNLADNDPEQWEMIGKTAHRALEARLDFLTHIQLVIEQSAHVSL